MISSKAHKLTDTSKNGIRIFPTISPAKNLLFNNSVKECNYFLLIRKGRKTVEKHRVKLGLKLFRLAIFPVP